jgi:hypothetical protein
MFVNNGAPVKRLGEMREDALPMDRVREMAKLVADRFMGDQKNNTKFKEELANALKFLASMSEDVPADVGGTTGKATLFLNALRDHTFTATTARAGIPLLNGKFANAAAAATATIGAEAFMAAPGAPEQFVPYGYGSYDGLVIIKEFDETSAQPTTAAYQVAWQAMWKRIKEDATKALEVFDNVYDFVQTKFRHTMTINPNFKPEWVLPDTADASRATFFANVFGAPLEPVWVTPTAGIDAGEITDASTTQNLYVLAVEAAAVAGAALVAAALPVGAARPVASVPDAVEHIVGTNAGPLSNSGVLARIKTLAPDVYATLVIKYDSAAANAAFLQISPNGPIVQEAYLAVYERLLRTVLAVAWKTGGDKSESNIDAFVARVRTNFSFFKDRPTLYYLLKRAMDLREEHKDNEPELMHVMYCLQKILVEANKTLTAGQMYSVIQAGLQMLRGEHARIDATGRDGVKKSVTSILADHTYDGLIVNKVFQKLLHVMLPTGAQPAVDLGNKDTIENLPKIAWANAVQAVLEPMRVAQFPTAVGGTVSTRRCTGLVGRGATMLRRRAPDNTFICKLYLNELPNNQVAAGNTRNDPRKRNAALMLGQPAFAAKHSMHANAKEKFKRNNEGDAGDAHGGSSRFGKKKKGGGGGSTMHIHMGAHAVHDDPEEDGPRRDEYGREAFPREPVAPDRNDTEFDVKYQEAMDETSDALKRFIMMVIIATPVTQQALNGFIEDDIPFPFGFLLMRPTATYLMGTGILTKGGAITGETLIGHTDFQLADNVVQKMHYGNFTMYLKSIVYKPDNVFLAENLYAGDYIGGLDSSMHDLRSVLSERTDSNKRSIYTCLVPLPTYDRTAENSSYMADTPNPIDCTGRFSGNSPHLAHIDADNDSRGRLHYATAEFYAQLYQWNNADTGANQMDGYAYESINRYNTVCFQGHQSMYNISSKAYDVTISNTGHWGDRVYPGCGRVRRGMMKSLEPVSFSSPFGMQKHIVQLGY